MPPFATIGQTPLLDIDNVYAQLCARKLLGPVSAIDGDLEITSSTRRNRNILVKSTERSFLIKQPEDETSAAETLRREIRFYRAFAEASSFPALASVLPGLAFADEPDALLGLDLLTEATAVWRYYESCGQDRFPAGDSEAIGAALARAHRELATAEAMAAADDAGLPSEPPPTLALASPRPSSRATMSLGALELLRRLQEEPALLEALATIEKSWLPTSVIHGDIKLDNILREDRDGRTRIYLVDWELAQIGDPAWDIGGALRDFIFFWVISMPSLPSVEEMADQARFPLDVLQPAILAFWRGYRNASPLSEASAEPLLERAIGFSAVRMIQTALDMAGGFPDVPAPADLLSRVAVNLTADVTLGRSSLFGLPAARPT